MKRPILCLALATLPALGQPGGMAPVTIYTSFQQVTPPPVAGAIRAEVTSIMAPLGLPLEWRSLATATGDEVSATLAVVTFRGDCTADVLTDAGSGGALGWTHVTDGVVLPFTEVDCGRIRGFLRRELLRVDPRERDRDLARAVGRVTAHELYHVFAGTRHHGSGGVAEPVYTQRELMANEFRFEDREFQTLRAGMLPALIEERRLQGSAQDSPQVGQAIFQSRGCTSCHGAKGEGTPLAPALRAPGKPVSFSTIAAKLIRDVTHMYQSAKDRKRKPPALTDAEIGDLVSFLNTP